MTVPFPDDVSKWNFINEFLFLSELTAIFTFLFFPYEVWNAECGSNLKFDVSMDLKMIEASSICVNPKQTTLNVKKSGTIWKHNDLIDVVQHWFR